MKKLLFLCSFSLISIAILLASGSADVPEGALGSIATKTAPKMDGMVDSLWKKAPALEVEVYVPQYPIFDESYFNDKYNVTMKSLYTESDIYFLYQWTGDMEESQERQSWYYNETEAKWMSKPKYKSDDYYGPTYEDKFAVIWNINDSIAGFNDIGCANLCHGDKKATNAEGEMGDVWHWKSDRNGPINQIDDKWLTYSDGNGRKGDEGTGSYTGNSQKIMDKAGNEISVPVYWIPGAKDYHWIMADDTRARKIVSIDAMGNLVDEDGTVLKKEMFNGDSDLVIPSIYNIKPGVGGRADVTEYHNYDESTNTWTLEVKRALVTGDKTDIAFDNLSNMYYFSIAVFDGAAIAHAIPDGMKGTSYYLVFR